MADPPEDDGLDTYLPATTEAEKKLVRYAEERLANGKVVKFDPKRKRTKKAPPPPPPGGWPSWHARLARDDRGRIISDIDNVLVALRGAEELQLACVYDEMLNASMVTRAWPKVAELAADERPIPREVDDDDVGLRVVLRVAELAAYAGFDQRGQFVHMLHDASHTHLAKRVRVAIGNMARADEGDRFHTRRTRGIQTRHAVLHHHTA